MQDWEKCRRNVPGVPRHRTIRTFHRSWAQSIQPKFPEISVQNSMDKFGPTGKVSKKTGPPFEVDHFSRSDRLEILVEWIAPLNWETDALQILFDNA